jgi:peptidoglycan/xylan/chitin deacetylase (PgdA/CDA1 family)
VSDYITQYREIKKLAKGRIRSKSRNIALTGLSLLDSLSGYKKYMDKPRVQFLYIHHIFNDEVNKLDRLLNVLKENHTFISYSEAVDRVLKSTIDKPYITLSSDDGFRNNLNSLEVLNKYGARACFFINPSIISENKYDKIAAYCKTKLNLPPIEFLNWSDVNNIQQSGHEIGSHTMSHINLAQSAPELAAEEISKSYEIIKTRCGEIKHFAFPYGTFNDFNRTSKIDVFQTGYFSCASAVRGCHIGYGSPMEANKLCIRRDHIVLDWETSHIIHFLIRNSLKASPTNNLFPPTIQ